MPEFITVCPTTEIPDGERAVFQINEHWVAIFNVGGRYYAVEDLCTHDGGILTEDDQGNPVPLKDDYIITCPRHGARFDIRTGEAKTPAITSVDVPFYEVRVQNGQIEVAI
jgi:3-phenylpropionate/trans-cinnamate dioxygenase ferredoxin subunit